MESEAKVIYFYKAYEPYGCFSNFSPHPIHCGDRHWLTVEHFYQAQKFVNTPDAAIISKIHQTLTPEAAAAIGRSPKYSPRQDWTHLKQDIMWQGLLAKFQTHTDIAQILVDTDNAQIVEDSPVDYYWGCGADGSGHNHLGRLLMKIRDILQESADKAMFTQ